MQTLFILILFAHVGALGDGNSNALATATFSTKAACENAGQQAKRLADGTVKKIEYTCAPYWK